MLLPVAMAVKEALTLPLAVPLAAWLALALILPVREGEGERELEAAGLLLALEVRGALALPPPLLLLPEGQREGERLPAELRDSEFEARGEREVEGEAASLTLTLALAHTLREAPPPKLRVGAPCVADLRREPLMVAH